MALEESTNPGRRSLLAAIAGAVAALVGSAVTAPSRALAADHDPVKIGELNSGTIVTTLSTPAAHTFQAESGGGDGLRGTTSADGKSGCYGWSSHAGGHGVFGRNTSNQNWGYVAGPNDAVQGHCMKPGRAGVKGTTDLANAFGILASNSATNTSVVLATSVALVCQAPSNSFGLVNIGKTLFTRSGVVTVAAGKRTAKVSSIAISDFSYVLATMQYPRTGVYIQAALPNVDTDSITIYLNKAVTYATKVAWFVLDNDPI